MVMNDLFDISEKIEEKRKQMFDISKNQNLNDDIVVKISEELDKLINEYLVLFNKEKYLKKKRK